MKGGVKLYKLKNSYIDKMISAKTSSKEIDFILHIAKYQSEAGIVYSVYYKSICDAINISNQKFYDILSSLMSKDLIECRKVNKIDYCITLKGNDFRDKDFSKGYLNVALQRFNKPEFTSLKAGAKLLYLYMQRFTEGRHMKLARFYDEFCELFHCVKKTLQEYLRALNEHFFVISKRKRNKSYNYELCMKNGKNLYLNMTDKMNLGSENDFYKKNIRQMICNNYGKYLPETDAVKKNDDILSDIAGLCVIMFKSDVIDVPLKLINAIKKSLNIQVLEGKKHPVLNAAHIHSCLMASSG